MTASEYSFRWMIDPVTPEAFFRDEWERRTLVVNRDRPDYYRSLLSLDEIDRVITTLGLSHPDISMVNAARELKVADYTFPSGMIDVARLYQHFADGSTIILGQLHSMVPSLAAFCRALEWEFSSRFQTNIYLTPGNAQGFKPHYDNHDVFVLQVAGTKHWRIYDTPVALPLRGQHFDPGEHEPGAVTTEFDLRPGDMAYVPRGIMHDAVSSDDGPSLHITTGVMGRTWTDLLLEALSAACLRDPSFRKTLPVGFARPGFDRGPARAVFRNLVQTFAASAGLDSALDEALDQFVDDLISTRHPLLRGQMEQIGRLAGLSPASAAGAQPNLLYRIEEDGESVTVTCQGAVITLPSHAGAALRFALETPRFTTADLPGDLDEDGRLVLVRRLVREGLVRLL